VNPEEFSALFNKGNTLLALKRYEEAIEYYDKALKIQPNNEFVQSNREEALKKLEEGRQ